LLKLAFLQPRALVLSVFLDVNFFRDLFCCVSNRNNLTILFVDRILLQLYSFDFMHLFYQARL